MPMFEDSAFDCVVDTTGQESEVKAFCILGKHIGPEFSLQLKNRPEHIFEREWIKQELDYFQIKKFASYLLGLFTSTLHR